MKQNKEIRVTPNPRRGAREWRVEFLDRWVRFAFDASDDAKHLADELTHLVRHTLRGWRMTRSEALDDLRWAQGRIKAAFSTIADGKEWSQSISEIAQADPQLTYYVVKGSTGTAAQWEGHSNAIVLKALEEIFLSPEASRIMRCAEKGCDAVFIRRKQGKYCDEHGSSGTRSERYREQLTPEEKRDRRHRYYLAALKRKDPAAWRHLISREKKRKQSIEVK